MKEEIKPLRLRNKGKKHKSAHEPSQRINVIPSKRLSQFFIRRKCADRVIRKYNRVGFDE